jgi:leukotriene-A4 hydrolase
MIRWMRIRVGLTWIVALVGISAFHPTARSARAEDPGRPDAHSFSRPDQVRVKRLDLTLVVDFQRKVLHGKADWAIERQPGAPADAPLVLDTRDLTIQRVEASDDGRDYREARFELGTADPVLGRPLTVTLRPATTHVRVTYRTSPMASALQWVDPAGTFGKQRPFLYTQSPAIHARSWIPCQDSPGVRVVYFASVLVPRVRARAVMAAEKIYADAYDVSSFNTPEDLDLFKEDPPLFRFFVRDPIPPYLIALAVGNLEFRKLGERTGVWAEPEIVEKAAREFADTEAMVAAAEKRFGPYRWGRYDILVLPPSFPYGGMENPMVTFATPTVLAGDRSQVALIAHELAHSWSGNLVTNATWRDFWLNEGFTVFLEYRIVEDVFGPDRAAMEQVLNYGELKAELARLDARDQVLHINLDGRDPDEGVTAVPYVKGALFLKALEAKVGREKLDAFLRGYFDHFAFRSITTDDLAAYLKQTLFPDGDVPIDFKAWFDEPGLPDDAPKPTSARFAEIDRLAKAWLDGHANTGDLDTKGWTTLEWLHFLRALPESLKADRMAELDAAFRLTESGNAEIACQWLGMAIRAGYEPALPRLAEFLKTVGRRKLVVPLYTALVKTDAGRARARAIFAEARAGYHPIAVQTIEALLKSGE